MKIIFMGTPEFACPTLQILANMDSFEVLAVVTQEDKKVGRHQVLMSPPVKILAQKLGIPVLQPQSLKENHEFIGLLRNLEPDFLVVVAYGHILRPEILEIPKIAAINIHTSLLPKYRGASPVEQALLQGDQETGITIMKMDVGMDTGDVYVIQKIPITANETTETLKIKLSQLGATLLPSTLQAIYNQELTPLPQNHSLATYCKKISKEDGKINFEQHSAEQILNMMRAFTPWPGCFFEVNEKKIKVLQAEIKSATSLKPSQCIITTEKKLLIGTTQENLQINEVQLEGKKALKIEEFLNGNKILFENGFII